MIVVIAAGGGDLERARAGIAHQDNVFRPVGPGVPGVLDIILDAGGGVASLVGGGAGGMDHKAPLPPPGDIVVHLHLIGGVTGISIDDQHHRRLVGQVAGGGFVKIQDQSPVDLLKALGNLGRRGDLVHRGQVVEADPQGDALRNVQAAEGLVILEGIDVQGHDPVVPDHHWFRDRHPAGGIEVGAVSAGLAFTGEQAVEIGHKLCDRVRRSAQDAQFSAPAIGDGNAGAEYRQGLILVYEQIVGVVHHYPVKILTLAGFAFLAPLWQLESYVDRIGCLSQDLEGIAVGAAHRP